MSKHRVDSRNIVIVGFGPEAEAAHDLLARGTELEVLATDDGAEALRWCESHPPDLLALPSLLVQPSAERCAQILRHHFPSVTLVFACESGLEESYLRARFAEPLRFLERPLPAGGLADVVRGQFGVPAVERTATSVRSVLTTRGRFSDTPFASVLVSLLENNATGILRITHGTVDKAVYFIDGVPTWVSSNVLSENLGRFLKRRGLVSEADLTAARRLQRVDGLRQGEALVQVGALTNADLFEQLAAQIEEKIINVFALEHAEYEFEPTDEFIKSTVRFTLNPLSILIEGEQRFQNPEAAQRFEEGAEYVCLVEANPQAPMWQFIDGPLPGAFRRWVADGIPLSEVANATGWAPRQLAAVVSAIEAAGLVSVERGATRPNITVLTQARVRGGGALRKPTQEVSPIFDSAVHRRVDEIMKLYLTHQSGTYYDALGLNRGASVADIEAARDRLIHRYGSPRFLEEVPLYAVQKIEEILEKVRMACQVLSDPDRRAAYDSAVDREDHLAQTDRLIEAEVQHVLGMDMLDEMDPPAALAYFERAVELNPDEPTYQLYLGWSAYISAPDDSVARRHGREMVTTAVNMNPLVDMGYYFLGEILLDDGDLSGAREQFETAIHFNPDNTSARAALRLLNRSVSGVHALRVTA